VLWAGALPFSDLLRCLRGVLRVETRGITDATAASETDPGSMDHIGNYRRIEITPLRRPRAGRKLAGVCAGMGEYLGVDPVVVRLVVVLATLFTMGTGALGYLLAWMVIPSE